MCVSVYRHAVCTHMFSPNMYECACVYNVIVYTCVHCVPCVSMHICTCVVCKQTITAELSVGDLYSPYSRHPAGPRGLSATEEEMSHVSWPLSGWFCVVS